MYVYVYMYVKTVYTVLPESTESIWNSFLYITYQETALPIVNQI